MHDQIQWRWGEYRQEQKIGHLPFLLGRSSHVHYLETLQYGTLFADLGSNLLLVYSPVYTPFLRMVEDRTERVD